MVPYNYGLIFDYSKPDFCCSFNKIRPKLAEKLGVNEEFRQGYLCPECTAKISNEAILEWYRKWRGVKC